MQKYNLFLHYLTIVLSFLLFLWFQKSIDYLNVMERRFCMKKEFLLLLMMFGFGALLTAEAQGRKVYDDNENTYDATGYDYYGNTRSVPRTERKTYYDDDAYDSRNADYYDDERNVPQRRKRTYNDEPDDTYGETDGYYYNPQDMDTKGPRVVFNDNEHTYDAVGYDRYGQLRSISRNGKCYRGDSDDLMSLYRSANLRNSQRNQPDRRRSYDDNYDYDQ